MTSRPETRFRRLKEKGNRDIELARSIIDAARMCHVGFSMREQPYVVPMAIAREGDRLLMHGSIASRLMKHLSGGFPCCVTVTHLDGLVLARSAFNSSMHYRSVMVFGAARAVVDAGEKLRGLNLLTEHLAPGRLAEVRPSTRQELNATMLLDLPLATFTVKVSNAPPDDPDKDLESDVWAGVIPLRLEPGAPVPAPDLKPGVATPAYIAGYEYC